MRVKGQSGNVLDTEGRKRCVRAGGKSFRIADGFLPSLSPVRVFRRFTRGQENTIAERLESLVQR